MQGKVMQLCSWVTRRDHGAGPGDDRGSKGVPRAWRILRHIPLMLVLGMSMNMIADAALSPDDNFDHFTTGFPLTGAHARVDCEGCHVGGVFRNASAQCESCHTRGGRVAASFKPMGHIPSTNSCDDCHVTSTWRLVRRVDHIAVIGTCARCHDGRTASGKPPGHMQSGNNCDQCHTTAAWTRIQFDHGGVAPGSCITCHNGVKATGKSPRHILSSDTCDSCHNTVRWSIGAGRSFGGGGNLLQLPQRPDRPR